MHTPGERGEEKERERVGGKDEQTLDVRLCGTSCANAYTHKHTHREARIDIYGIADRWACLYLL